MGDFSFFNKWWQEDNEIDVFQVLKEKQKKQINPVNLEFCIVQRYPSNNQGKIDIFRQINSLLENLH